MALTSSKDIQIRLADWNDTVYTDSLHAQMCYAFGERWNYRQNASGGGTLPWYESIVVRKRQIGATMRILNSAMITLGKVMYGEPEPEFPQVHPVIGEARKQVWLSRFRGEGYPDAPEWGQEFDDCFLEGDGLGVSYLEHGFVTNPRTGRQRSTIRHSPTIFTLTDRHQSNPSKYTGVAFVKHIDPEDAARLYGRERADKARHRIGEDCAYDVVRVIEYYDTGYGKSDPTYAVFLDDIDTEPVVRRENWAGCLPFSYYIHALLPGMSRPVGRIVMQMATQEARNQLEARMRKTVFRAGMDLFNMQTLNKEDVNRYLSGKNERGVLRFEGSDPGGMAPVTRIAEAEIGVTQMQLLKMYDAELAADSGVTSFDRGSAAVGDRTATEVQAIDARSQVQGAWSRKQAVKMFQRSVAKWLHLAGMYDTDPVDVDVFGTNLRINDPSVPASSFAEYAKEPSKVVINSTDLESQDQERKRSLRIQRLASLFPLVQAGLINPVKFAEEAVRAIGEQEARDWLSVMPPMAAQGGQSGMVQGQEGMFAGTAEQQQGGQ